MIIPHTEHLYIRGDIGGLLKVTGIFETDDEANKFMAADHTESLIRIIGKYRFTCKYNDLGLKQEDLKRISRIA